MTENWLLWSKLGEGIFHGETSRNSFYLRGSVAVASMVPLEQQWILVLPVTGEFHPAQSNKLGVESIYRKLFRESWRGGPEQHILPLHTASRDPSGSGRS